MRTQESEVSRLKQAVEYNDLLNAVAQMQDAFAILKASRNNEGDVTDFIVNYINKTASKRLNVPPEKAAGKYISSFFPTIKDTRLYSTFLKVTNSGRSLRLKSAYFSEAFKRRKIKGLFDFTISKYNDGCAVSWRNITESIKKEKALKVSEENFRLALKNTKITVARIDTHLKITWIYNPLPDFDPSIAGGIEAYKMIDEKSAKNIRGKFLSVFETKIGVQFEQKITVRGIQLDYEIQAEPSFNSQGKLTGLFIVAINITDYKDMERKLTQILKRLEFSNQELEQFAYVASHDLQEPLRIILSFSNLLAGKYGGSVDERQKEYLGFISGSAKRMQNLINELLEYSRITTKAKPFEKVDLNSVLRDVLADLSLMIERSKAQIKTDFLPTITAEPVQMHRLFLNLISNAIKFCDKEYPVISIAVREKRELYVFCITDNGIGIERKFYARIFQIFQRLHEEDKYPGSGMGLAICKKIIERHKGRIWLKSRPGAGTTFYFALYK